LPSISIIQYSVEVIELLDYFQSGRLFELELHLELHDDLRVVVGEGDLVIEEGVISAHCIFGNCGR
jgi:hypothetical protein